MAQTQLKIPKKISVSHLINIVLVVILVGAAIFGYLYFMKVDPVAEVTNALPANGPGQPKFLFNLWGSETENFVRPLDVTVNGNRIYALDARNYVSVFDNTGKYITRFGGPGTKDGQLKDPQSLAAYNGNIYVADMGKRKIVIYGEDGNFSGYFAEKDIKVPYYIRFSDGKFYVQESFQVKVLDTAGKLIATLGGRGLEKGQLGVSIGVTTDKEGNIYVMDTGNYRIQAFGPQGKFKFSWGKRPGVENPEAGDTPEYDYSRGIAIDGGGFIWIARPMSRMVSVLDPETGKKLADLTDVETEGKGFGGPTNLYIDDNNRLFVIDQVAKRIAVFQL